MKKTLRLLSFLLALLLLLSSCDLLPSTPSDTGNAQGNEQSPFYHEKLGEVPVYNGDPFVIVNNGVPTFTDEEKSTASYETYAPLDSLGRCGVCIASIGVDIMPTAPRESISSVYPSGWDNNPYDFVDGGYLYNRCHLIGFQLTGENANKNNLITGTRYLNIEGMLPFENMIADYVKDTENHVVFRVTPIYNENDLVASGVWMEAYSIEDEGEGISFSVYAFNVQPGVVIDYADGSNYATGEETPKKDETPSQGDQTEAGYVINKKSGVFHRPSCVGVKSMSAQNRVDSSASREALVEDGYRPCGTCDP